MEHWVSCMCSAILNSFAAAQFVDVHVDADVPANADVNPELEVQDQ
jgi:hypothetical protein